MNPKFRHALLVALIAVCAGIAGAWIGRIVIPAPPPPRAELHDFLHNQLALDVGQRARLEALEADFTVRKNALEGQLRANNADLAGAIGREHGEGPQVTAAVDASHHAMGELQKLTLAHIFAMRALMRPDQAAKFDAAVTRALTDQQR